MNKQQKRSALLVFLLLIAMFHHTSAYAGEGNHWIAAGSVKRIQIDHERAIEIKNITTVDKTISARIVKQFDNKIEIKVVADGETQPGQHKLILHTKTNTIRVPLYVFGVTEAKFSYLTQTSKVGLTQVKLHIPDTETVFHVQAPMQTYCIASTTEDRTDARAIHRHPMRMQHTGTFAYVWLGVLAQNNGSKCNIILTETHPLLAAEVSRKIIIHL